MKRIALSLLMVFTIAASWAQIKVQDYEPTLNWPFLLDDFYQSTIIMGTDTVCKTRVNYHLRSEALYCINDEGKIARVILPNMNCVLINNNVYRFVNGKLMLQLHAEEGALLLDLEYIDFDLMTAGYNQGHALYARSYSDHNMLANRNDHINLSALHMKGEFNERYAELKSTWYDGEKLPIKHRYFFMINGKVSKASQSDCYDLLDTAGQQQFKAFLKSKKPKWRKKEDLIAIAQFLKTQVK